MDTAPAPKITLKGCSMPGLDWAALRGMVLHARERLTPPVRQTLRLIVVNARTGFTWVSRQARLRFTRRTNIRVLGGLGVVSAIILSGVPASADPILGGVFPGNSSSMSRVFGVALGPQDTQTYTAPAGLGGQVLPPRDEVQVVKIKQFDSEAADSTYFQMWIIDGQPSYEEILRQGSDRELDGGSVAELARTAAGIPYVMNGSNPFGFDCSGLIRHVFAHYGVPLAHSVSAMDEAGRTVSASKARPGDLVIWNDNSHAAIYVGDGMIVHAPLAGRDVEYRDLFSSDVHFVRITK